MQVIKNRIYVAFFDSETNKETFGSGRTDQILEQRNFAVSDNIVFDAYQLDPDYPDYCDSLWISWIITRITRIERKKIEIVVMEYNPFTSQTPYEEELYIDRLEIIPTFCNGSAEFHGFLLESVNPSACQVQ